MNTKATPVLFDELVTELGDPFEPVLHRPDRRKNPAPIGNAQALLDDWPLWDEEEE